MNYARDLNAEGRLQNAEFCILHFLFYLQIWRNVVVLPHLPEGTHSLAPRPGTLAGGHSKVVLAFGAANARSNRQPAYRLTRTSSARFRFRPNWSAWQDLHLQPFRFERNASTLGYTRMVPTAGFAPALCAF